MVKVACPPASVVVKPLVGVTVIPAISSSALVTVTSATAIPLYKPSVLVAVVVMI